MHIFIKKLILFSLLYVLSQLLLMGLVWMFFGINLFETSETSREIMDLSKGELKMLIALNQFIGLFLPACIFLIVEYKSSFYKQIGLGLPEEFKSLLLGLGILLFSFPVIQFLVQINEGLPLAEWMSETSGEIMHYMQEITEMHSDMDLLINLLLIAVLPALAEELLFRGVMQKELIKLFRSPHLAIILTSIAFSAFHFQFDGFLPRLYIGLILGYAYFYSKQILVPFLMHFTNNAILLLALYYKPENANTDTNVEMTINYPLLIISFLVVLFLVLLFRKELRNED